MAAAVVAARTDRHALSVLPSESASPFGCQAGRRRFERKQDFIMPSDRKRTQAIR